MDDKRKISILNYYYVLLVLYLFSDDSIILIAIISIKSK